MSRTYFYFACCFFFVLGSPKSIGRYIERGRNLSETARRVKTFSLLLSLFFVGDSYGLPPGSANEGAIYQKPYSVSRLNFILCHLSHFLHCYSIKTLLSPRKTGIPDAESRARHNTCRPAIRAQFSVNDSRLLSTQELACY